MNKFILGSILAAISLMVIYGTSASNQVTSWVDGEDSASAQSDSGLSNSASNDSDDSFIALNSNESEREPNIDINDRTPLQKAGDIPKRQIGEVTSTPNFGQPEGESDTEEPIVPQPVENPPPTDTSAGNNTGNQPANPAPSQEPIEALW
ncbi:hypothetical protein IQ260_08610 [Leptolyngbya cf. ectocarpi LEGE 11479]|uniref:Uncharacterized protein n=1 Tax=Leptolyngbya cf. ectocarpi LEGE 11479 TaxID=1828722 RepID=A0A928X0J0_LEPEC|nr:hypothetical protein [Leptolyngbya ectocarpi]MBE9066712.1 hypothetical protein [Leptolyngbya cf. ectocarpi LEGE 11479]